MRLYSREHSTQFGSDLAFVCQAAVARLAISCRLQDQPPDVSMVVMMSLLSCHHRRLRVVTESGARTDKLR
jgi:hypothetical protein